MTDTARAMLAAGADVDQIATELLRRTDSPISAIKAMTDGTGLGLAGAKLVVHRNLLPEVREAAESLWSDLIDGLSQFHEQPRETETGPRRTSPGPPAAP